MASRPNRVQLVFAFVGAIIVVATAGFNVVSILAAQPNTNPTEHVIDQSSKESMSSTIEFGSDFDEDDLEKEQQAIAAMLEEAYSLKASAFEDASDEELANLYIGPALVQRQKIIKQIPDDCYWEVALVEPEEFNIQTIETNLAEVLSVRVEARQQVCDGNIQPDTRVEADRYQVYYYLTRQDGDWHIIDMKVRDIQEDS